MTMQLFITTVPIPILKSLNLRLENGDKSQTGEELFLLLLVIAAFLHAHTGPCLEIWLHGLFQES